jgi:hypothetical protein
LFRSDNDDLPFDVSNIMVITYDPDNTPERAMKLVSDSISSAISKYVDLKANLTVQHLAGTVDEHTLWILKVIREKAHRRTEILLIYCPL